MSKYNYNSFVKSIMLEKNEIIDSISLIVGYFNKNSKKESNRLKQFLFNYGMVGSTFKHIGSDYDYIMINKHPKANKWFNYNFNNIYDFDFYLNLRINKWDTLIKTEIYDISLPNTFCEINLYDNIEVSYMDTRGKINNLNLKGFKSHLIQTLFLRNNGHNIWSPLINKGNLNIIGNDIFFPNTYSYLKEFNKNLNLFNKNLKKDRKTDLELDYSMITKETIECQTKSLNKDNIFLENNDHYYRIKQLLLMDYIYLKNNQKLFKNLKPENINFITNLSYLDI